MMHYFQTTQKKGNLLRNPGFEDGLNYWKVNNVTLGSDRPFEGTASARLGSGEASLSQDIVIKDCKQHSFLFAFAVQAPLGFDPGNLTVDVLWVRNKTHSLKTGLRMFIPSVTMGEQLFWLNYTNVTKIIPQNTDRVRIIFRKEPGTGSPNDVIEIDNVLFIQLQRKELLIDLLGGILDNVKQ